MLKTLLAGTALTALLTLHRPGAGDARGAGRLRMRFRTPRTMPPREVGNQRGALGHDADVIPETAEDTARCRSRRSR